MDSLGFSVYKIMSSWREFYFFLSQPGYILSPSPSSVPWWQPPPTIAPYSACIFSPCLAPPTSSSSAEHSSLRIPSRSPYPLNPRWWASPGPRPELLLLLVPFLVQGSEPTLVQMTQPVGAPNSTRDGQMGSSGGGFSLPIREGSPSC